MRIIPLSLLSDRVDSQKSRPSNFAHVGLVSEPPASGRSTRGRWETVGLCRFAPSILSTRDDSATFAPEEDEVSEVEGKRTPQFLPLRPNFYSVPQAKSRGKA